MSDSFRISEVAVAVPSDGPPLGTTAATRDTRLDFLNGLILHHTSLRRHYVVQIVLIILLGGLCLYSIGHAADETADYDSGYEPPRISPWPVVYKDYQLLPLSQSPNQKYAFIYPKRTLVEEENIDAKLYLVGVRPFRVLFALPIKGANLCGNAHGSYNVAWTDDSLVAMFQVGSKWGPDYVFIVPLFKGQAGKVTDIEAEVRKIVQPSYTKSKADRFNDYFDFLFVDGDSIQDSNGKLVDQTTEWSINDRHQAVIKCICTNDPHHSRPHNWEVIFQGTWDIVQSRFIKYEYRGISNERLVPF